MGLKADVKAEAFCFTNSKALTYVAFIHSPLDKPASECHLDMAVMAKYHFQGVGEQVPILDILHNV